MTETDLLETPKGKLAHLPPLKITVAPNGARRTKDHHCALPMTIPEIVETAQSCFAAGADEIHLHVRDASGQHSLDPGLYREAIAAISATVPEMTIQITTESAGLFDIPTQLATLTTLHPAAASVSVREVLRRPDLAKSLYHGASKAGTVLQHILYSQSDLIDLHRLLDDGTVPDHQRDVILVFGTYDPPKLANPGDVPAFVDALKGEFPNWTLCAFGHTEPQLAEAAIRLGGHLRIGFENNVQRPDGSPAMDNAENIARAAATAKSLGRRLLKEVSKP